MNLEPNKPRRKPQKPRGSVGGARGIETRRDRARAEGRVNVLMSRPLVEAVEAEGIVKAIGWSPYVRLLVEKDLKSRARARKRAGGKT